MTGRAITEKVEFYAISSFCCFPVLVQKMPELAKRLVGLMSDRIRETSPAELEQKIGWLGPGRGIVRRSLRMLNCNNVRRPQPSCATSQLVDVLETNSGTPVTTWGRRELYFGPAKRRSISWKLRSPNWNEHPPDALTMSDLEEQIDSLLRSHHGQNDLWQLAADLARKNVKPEALESLFGNLDADTARAALVRIAASVEIAGLLNEIESSATRISELVGAIKEYTYMDQAPVQNVDIVKGLETTLTILNHKLVTGGVVECSATIPRPRFSSIRSGSELNQVSTNLIGNGRPRNEQEG